jgi:hypothetical protein
MTYNYAKLRGRIIEVYGSRGAFAKAMGMSEHTLTQKMHGRVDWKQSEILRASNLLGIGEGEIVPYFFALEVQY